MKPTIRDLAIAVVHARQQVIDLKRERNACRCGFEVSRWTADDWGEPMDAPARSACWALVIVDNDGNAEPAGGEDPTAWCESCQRRQALHERWRVARLLVGPARNRLRIAVLRGDP